MTRKFYKCKRCGKIIAIVEERETPTVCCGEEMVELVPNTQEAAVEKHQPVIKRSGQEVVVRVGEVDHPMLENHYIEWIVLMTKNATQRVVLRPGDEPVAKFYIAEDDEVEGALAYCNLHSLWKNK